MTNAIETSRQQPSLISQLNQSVPELARLGIDPDRFARTVATQIRQNPALASCDPGSVLGAVFTCAQLDLEPGPAGYSWLVPFKGKCTFILGYRGMVELARRVGVTVTVGSVYPGDHFAERGGTDPDIEHVHGPGHGDGDPVRWYAVAHLPNGLKVTRSLTRQQVEHRRQSGNSGNSPAWRDHFDAMARKTAVRALWATLPMGMSQSMQLAESAEADTPRIPAATGHVQEVDTNPDTAGVDTDDDVEDAQLVEDEPEPGLDLDAAVVLEIEQLRPDAGLSADNTWAAWLRSTCDGAAGLDDLDNQQAATVLDALRRKAAA